MRTFATLLLLASVAAAQEYRTVSFDRVNLRNGNAIDGEIVQKTAYGVEVKIQGGSVIVKADTIESIERVTMRYVVPPKKVEPPPEPEKPAETPVEDKPAQPTGEQPVAPEQPAAPAAAPLSEIRSSVKLDDATRATVHNLLNQIMFGETGGDDKPVEELLKLKGDVHLYLADVLDQLDPALVGAVSGVLSRANNSRTVKPVRDKLESKRADVRSAAVNILVGLNDTGSVPAIRSMAEKDPAPQVQESAVEALRRFQDEDSLKLFLTLMQGRSKMLALHARRAFTEIVRGKKLNDRAEEFLERLVNGRLTQDQIEIASLLGDIGADKRAINILLGFFGARDPEIRGSAIYQLGRLKARDIAKDLVALSEMETNPKVLIQIFDALEKIGDQKVVRALIDRIGHDNKDVRMACAKALRTLTGQSIGPDPEAWREWYKKVTQQD